LAVTKLKELDFKLHTTIYYTQQSTTTPKNMNYSSPLCMPTSVLAAIFIVMSFSTITAETISTGAGAYRTDLPPKLEKPRRSIEASPLVSEKVTGAIPTNDWWSSLVWPTHSPHSMPMFPHPLAVQAHADGLGIGYTSQPSVTDHRNNGKIFQVGSDYRYPYRESLRVGLDGVGLDGIETKNTVLDSYSDWAVTALWKQDANELRATFAHGSPFVFFEKKSDSAFKVKFSAAKIDATREPVAPFVIEWKDITAKHNGKPAVINLSLNAGKDVGIGSKARLVYDFDGDGKTDRTETFELFATDPNADSWESYSSAKQGLDDGLTRGDMQDFQNGTIRLEYWKCFGKGTVELNASESSLQLPDGVVRSIGETNITVGETVDNVIKTFYDSGSVLGITLNGSHFGIFAPAGSKLTGSKLTDSKPSIAGNEISAAVDFLTIAVLPDDNESTLKYFGQHAYAFLRDTKISYHYDAESSTVKTTYTVETESMQGENTKTLFALYRHQHLHTDPDRLEAFSYASPRGEMRVVSGQSFSTTIPFLGVLPCLPNGKNPDLIAALKKDAKDFQFTREDTYWNGKEFGKVTELIQIAEQVGETEIRDQLLSLLKDRLEDWFDGKEKYFFYYDERWDTLTGYPDSYGSGDQLNDHHFHYSYFIKAAATIAQYDPDWVKPERYGKMIDLLIRDCASYDRSDDRFPWMRSFDPYAGHSWAAGHAGFASGNNQESSSESMNFATSLILYGQAIGDDKIRDLGIYWHSTEAEAIRNYWFDQDGEVFPTGFEQTCVGMVWGDGASYGTWWTANPEEIHGINFLPLNGGSLYLGRDVDYVKRNRNNLNNANRSFHTNGFEGEPNKFDRWQDVLAEYLALADPAAALQESMKLKDSELGETKTHTYQWITSLAILGPFDATVQANHPTAMAFKNGYVTYNPTSEPIIVEFSDGKTIRAMPGIRTARR